MGLNHIYKVIWSKTKNAWIVVSEIAKRDGKSSVKSVVTSLAGKSVAAVMVAMVMCGGVASANTVYGPGATTGTSTNVTVVGDNAQVDNYSNNAVAIGSNAKTQNGTKSISIGSDSSVDGQFGIAIGAGATLKSASTFESIVIGYNAKNEYADVVIGKSSSAKNYWSTVVGADSSSVGQYSTLVGNRNIEYKALSGAASQTNANSILGHNNSVMGSYNTILGQQNIVNSNGSVTATGATGVEHNVVVGYANGVRGNQNIVLGMNGTFPTYGNRNIVIGQSSGTAGSVAPSDTIGIGSRALTYNNNAIALGTSVTSTGQTTNYSTSIAIGNGLNSDESIVIGAKGTSDTSFSGMAGTSQSIMVGYTNGLIAGNKSVIIGSGNKGDSYTDRSVNNSVILGSSNTVREHEKQVIVGSNNYVRGKRIVAIGNNINADSTSHDGAVIIGDSSRYSYFDRPSGNITVNGINIDSTKFAGNSSTLTNGNYMSVGASGNERQIKNVAAGQISSSSTDAVNGSQLYEAVRAVTVGANPDVYMHVNDGTSTQGAGNATTNLGKANEKGGATGNVAVAIGKGATAQGNMAIAIGGYSSNANAGESIAMLGSVDASAEYGIAIGHGTRVQGSRGTVLGMGASSIGSGATALGSSSYAVGDGSVSLGYYNSAYAKNSVAIGPNTGTENGADNSVAIGYGASADYNATNAVAIGGARVGYSAMTGVGHISTTIDNSNSIAIGNGVQVFHKNTVAIGSYDNRTRTSFHTAGSTIPWQTDHNKLITPITATDMGMYGSVSTGFIEGTLGNSVYLGHESYAFTPNPLVDDESNLTGEQSIHTKKYDATGNIVVSNNTTGGAFGKVSKATINGDEITGFAGAQSVGAVTIGAGDYERRIQNVAAGEVSATSTDGINGSQLYAVANTLSKNMSGYMHINDGTSTQTVGNAITNYGYSGSKAGATGTKAIAGGMNAQASGDDAIAMGTWSSAAGEKAVAQGAHSTATDKGAVAIGGSYELSNAVKAENKGAVAIGSISTNIAGNDSLRGSVASGKNSIAILGSTGGENAVAMGTFASATANSSIAIGKKSLSSSAGSIAIGENTRVIDVNTGTINSGSMVAIGKGFSAIGNKSVVIGFNNGNDSASPMVAGNESVILGNQSSVWTNKITSGTMTSIDDIPKGSHIIGNRSMITESKDSVVVGNDSTITNADESIAIGKKASVEAANSIAIGSGAKASGEKSISIGTGNEVKGNKSSAIGDPSYIDTTATGTHVQGNDNGTATNPIKASESTFMGNTNLAGTVGTTGIHVVGNSNTVDSSNVMVMGNGVNVGTGLDGAVVLGNASSADQYAAATDSTINGVTFEAAGYAGNTGLNNGSIVSVGATGTERQIKNVAAGAVTATSTDAVNGSQLYKTAETILKMPINMAGDSGDTVGLKLGKTVNIKGSVASGADVTDGNIAVVGDKATSTLSLKMAKNLTGLTSGTFTDASGNQTVINGAGVTVTPTGTGATPISITTSGINAGNQEIKGVKKGTTDDAAVNKKQMDDALAGISSTLTINDGTTDGSVNIKTGKLKVVGESGANALVTTTVSGDTITVGTSTKLQNAVTAAENSADKDLSNLSTTGSDTVKTLAQDAVKVAGTGLATVSDATVAGVKTYTVNVDEGKLVIDDTTGKIGAAGASQGTVQGKDGVATTQNVASVVNSAIDKTKQALDDAKHNFAGDDATVISRKHGEQLNIKGGASTTASDLTSGNIAVVGDTTSGTLNIKMAKALTGLTSATYTDTAGNTQTVTGGSSTISDAAGNSTVVSKGGVTTTDGTNTTTVAPTGVTATDGTNTVKLTGSGIDAGNTQIKNVGKATTDDAAVNKKQMDDALKGATDNTVSLGSESGSTTAKKLSTTGGIKFNIKGETGANALITTSATGDDVTIAPTAKLTAAVTAAEKSADKDLSNISPAGETVIKNLAATSAQDAVKVTGTGLATVSDSTTGGVKTYNVDVKTGNLVVNAAGQAGAAGTTGAGGAAGADGVATTQNVASAINDAITKSKTDTAQAIADAEHKFDGDTGTTSVRKHGEVLSVKGGVTATTDLTTGNIGVVSDGAGTLNIRLAKVLSGLTSASFTNAGGDSTVINGNGVTITPSATGASPISMTTAGINAGNKEIKGVANATSADAAVNKAQMDAAITAAAGGSLSTEKVVAKTLTGDTNLATVTGQTGTAKGETYEVAVSENAVKAVAQTAAQDAVKVTGTGLANVTDSTTGGVKTYNVDVKTGNLVVNAAGQAGAAGTTGAGGAAGADGVATTQNVASAINDAITKSKTDTAQAIADAEHKFDGDTGTTSVRKHGEVLSIKGGVTNTADLTTGNIGVVSDGAGTLNIRLAKTLTGLTSAAFTDGTHTVTIAGSGIDAGNTEIKHVGKATTDDAAVNKKQMDDAVKAATDSVTTLGDNKVSLGSDSGTTTAKKLSTTGGIKFNIKGDTGANALITTSATGDDVTIAPTAKLSAAVTAAENSANKDLSNLSTAGNTYIQNLAKSAASWNVETNGGGTTAVAGGDTVNFINGDNIAITNTGRSITIGTAKNVSFDKVTVGGVVIDKNNGIDAGGKEITNVGPATSGNSAVNKTQMDTAITNAVNKATTDAKHDFGGDDTTVVTRKHGEKLNIKGGASTTAADLTSGNIAVLGDATTGTLNIRMAKALTGLSSATFTTPSGTTVINGGGMTITPSTTGAAPISITTGGINAGNTEIKNVAAGTTPNSAVNKQQMDSAISNATANVGFSTAGNTGTGSVSNGQTLTITGTNGIETNASGQSITVGLDAATRAQINNATTTANNAAKKDLSNIDNAGKQVIKNTAAWNVKVNGAAAETVKGGDTVTFNDGDNIKVTNTGKDITIATKKDVSFDKVTVGNVVIDKNTNRISGLANAANNDEAVNLGQMNAAISTATAGTGNIKYKANGGTQNSVALTTGFDFKGDSNIQITADPANSGVINYKLNPALTGITSISGGTGAPTITLNAGSGSTPGNVSINSNLDMGGKQINNIGAATHAGDAVNKAQMDQALQNIAGASSNAAKSYAYKAGAGAAALAALKPIQYDPLEPTQIMAGIGNYKSQTAVALGVAHYTNENTMFNLGVSLDSHDGIVNAGVTHKFGYSPEKKAIPDKYKGGPISSIYVMQDEVTALQAIVQKQAAENEALRQQNEDMQRKVDMILSKIH